MQNLVHLRGELLIDTRDHLLDRVKDVFLDDRGVAQRFLDQGRDRILDLGRRALGARLEALLEQRLEIVGLLGRGRREGVGASELFISHGSGASVLVGYLSSGLSPSFSASASRAAARSLSDSINCGSASSFLSWSSAATLPSM